jgi:hypothetical protein
MRTVNFYRLLNGYSPVEEFLDSLTGKQAQKVLWVLQIIEELDAIPFMTDQMSRHNSGIDLFLGI